MQAPPPLIVPFKYTKLFHEYPPIYGLDKTNRTRIWQASVFASADEKTGIYVVQHGVYNGKLQIDTREYHEGKNIGKKNETTGLQQCVAEIEKKRNDKIEKESYNVTRPVIPSPGTSVPAAATAVDCEETSTTRKIFPMLANKFEPAARKQHIQFPCFVQPKLDGLRCVVYQTADGETVFQSRTGGTFTTLGHLNPFLAPLFEINRVLVLDGELYTNKLPFEELAGIIKKKTLSPADKERILAVEYHVYDVVLADMPFSCRLDILQRTLSAAVENSPICLVPTYIANNVGEFREKFGQFVAEGYEGIMLRNQGGFYVENFRSNDLLKYKEFKESEFVIVGFSEGVGRDAGTVIWMCRTPEGRDFHVRPKGTLEFRRQLFQNACHQLGKLLTVVYQELSEMGVPRFPVGKDIRENY